MDDIILYLFVALFLFFFYFIVITIFGIFSLNYLGLSEGEKPSRLKLILKSYALGLSIHTIYCVVIISFNAFNFFTSYFPFIIVDLCFCIYFFLNSTQEVKLKLNGIKSQAYKFLTKNKGLLIMLLIVFFLFYNLYLYFINIYLAFRGNDPFFWFGNIWYLHKYQKLNFIEIESYPPGFVSFYATIISIYNDYEGFYYIMKVLPIFTAAINLLVILTLAQSYFKRKIYVFFTLMMFLSVNYLNYRSTIPIPSILATNLMFLFLLFIKGNSLQVIHNDLSPTKEFFLTRLKNKYVIVNAIILSAIFLIHPLYCLYILTFYFSYEISILILFILRKERPRSNKQIIKLFTRFLIIQFVLICYIFLLLLPYVIGYSINVGYPVLGTFINFFPSISVDKSYVINAPFFGPPLRDLGVWLRFFTFYYYIDQFLMLILGPIPLFYFYNETIQIGIFIIIYGLFLNFRKYIKLNFASINLYNFFKFTFVFTFLICTIYNIAFFIPIPFFQDVYAFLYIYYTRMFELFSGLWMIVLVLAINFFFLRFKQSNNNLRNLKRKITVKNIQKIEVLVIILISSFFFISNFGRISHNNKFSNERVEIVLYAGDYFNDRNMDNGTGIVLENLTWNYVYDLIVNKDIDKKFYNFSSKSNYTDFYSRFENHSCRFTIFNVSLVNSSFIANFTKDFIIIYSNVPDLVFAAPKTYFDIEKIK